MTMIDTRLREADPALLIEPDANSTTAQSLLARVLTSPREESPARPTPTLRHSGRRIAIGGVLAGIAATVALAIPLIWGHDGASTTTSAYAVTTDGSGAVHIAVHWNRLADPAALQAALDRADARVKIRVLSTNKPDNCLVSAHLISYSSRAVQWQSPGTPDGGFTVRPDDFPANATFVVTVNIAPVSPASLSTFAPGQPRLRGFAASMVRNPLPVCAR